MDGGNTFDSTLGLLEIGVMLAIFLFGVCTVQTFTYFNNFPNDSRKTKCLVGVVWFLESVHVALTCHSIYRSTVTLYGRPETLPYIPRTLSASVILSGIIGPIVQAYFALRVLKLSKQWSIPLVCWILSFLRFLSLIAVSVATFISPAVAEFRSRWSWLLVTSLTISAGLDILIAGSLCYYLYDHRVTGIARTQRVVERLMAWSIQTGLLTSISTVIMLIFFITMDNFAWLVMFMLISRLFSNSLMATLNARTKLRTEFPTFFEPHAGQDVQTPNFTHPIAIEMKRSREVTIDAPQGYMTGFRQDSKYDVSPNDLATGQM